MMKKTKGGRYRTLTTLLSEANTAIAAHVARLREIKTDSPQRRKGRKERREPQI